MAASSDQGFAKLFGIGRNQIVVMVVPEDPDGPVIRLFYDPRIDGLTISSSAVTFKTPEIARKAFDSLTASQVRAYVDHRIAQVKEVLDGDPEPAASATEPEGLPEGGPGGG